MQGFFQVARGAARSSDGLNNTNDVSQGGSGGTAAGLAGIVVKATPGRLYNLAGFNKTATAYTLMVFDKASAPVNTDAPVIRKHLAANGDATIALDELGLFGRAFQNGISIAISSTPDTLTLAVSADLHWHAQYK